MRLGLIGYGTIAGIACEALKSALRQPLSRVVVLARPEGVARAAQMLDACGDGLSSERLVVVDTHDFARSIDLAVEAAGHGAVRAHGPVVLASGVNLIVTSTGALSDDLLRAELDGAASIGRSRYELHGGAIGGLDLLAAAKLAGLERVTYISRKPPAAWRGTPAEQACDLGRLTAATTFFEGDARAAARDYPQNANVAATIALMGLGFSETRVKLIADPHAERNTHEIAFVSQALDATITIAGHPAPSNPKTSATTGYSLAASILNRIER